MIKVELSKRTGMLSGEDITLDELGKFVQDAMRSGATGAEPVLSMSHGWSKHTSYLAVEIDTSGAVRGTVVQS